MESNYNPKRDKETMNRIYELVKKHRLLEAATLEVFQREDNTSLMQDIYDFADRYARDFSRNELRKIQKVTPFGMYADAVVTDDEGQKLYEILDQAIKELE